VGASRCEDCGSELISLDDEDDDLYLAEGSPTLRPVVPAEAPPAEPGEPETRPLSGRPSPSLLKETTIMIPAQLSLLDSFERKAEKTFTLRIGATNIGRGTDNELSFPEEEFISRHHCQIAFHRYQYVLKDLQSANGTFVNDVKIQETILRDGDHIQIGSLRFIFEDPVERMKKKRMDAR
jgi:pSer/pThr/pTyr-binding forkhead associated (FHA) protein